MIEEWTAFKGWVVLEYFLMHPNTRIHINELSRQLKISWHTAQRFCKGYYSDGLLGRTKIGNVHQFYLNENDPRVRILKRFIGSYIVRDYSALSHSLRRTKTVLSVSLYGNFASGEIWRPERFGHTGINGG